MQNGSISVRTSGGISEALLHRVVSLEGSVDPGAYTGGQSAAESAVADVGNGDVGSEMPSGGAEEENKEDDEQQKYKPSPPPSSPGDRRNRPLQMSDLDAPAVPKNPKPPSRSNASTVRVASAASASRSVRASSSRAFSKLRRSIAQAEDIDPGLKGSVRRKNQERAGRKGRGVVKKRFKYDSRLT